MDNKKQETYAESVLRAVNQRNAQSAQQRQAIEAEQEERTTPLHDRVSRLLNTLSDEEKSRGLVMAELCNRLLGTHRSHAHPVYVAKALRRQGYVRRRNWRNESESFAARWYPPSTL